MVQQRLGLLRFGLASMHANQILQQAWCAVSPITRFTQPHLRCLHVLHAVLHRTGVYKCMCLPTRHLAFQLSYCHFALLLTVFESFIGRRQLVIRALAACSCNGFKQGSWANITRVSQTKKWPETKSALCACNGCPALTCVQALQLRLRALSVFLLDYQQRKLEQLRKARAKPASFFGRVGLGGSFGIIDSKGRANPPAKRQRLDDPAAQEADR